jgi:hypothetical protein
MAGRQQQRMTVNRGEYGSAGRQLRNIHALSRPFLLQNPHGYCAAISQTYITNQTHVIASAAKQSHAAAR